MASYYEQVEEAIKNNEKELAHLRDELRGLRSVEKDTPRESFQRQHAQILYHIDQEQKRLEENRTLLDNYHAARDGIAELRVSRDNEELDKLRALLAAERDPQIRREILEELEAKEKVHNEKIEALETTVQTSMAGLTDELREELRQSFLTEDEEKAQAEEFTGEIHPATDEEIISGEKTGDTATGGETDDTLDETGTGDNDGETDENVVMEEAVETDETQEQLEADLEAAERELEEAEAALQTSISRFQSIFEEERTRRENEGPFGTEEELDNFTNEYMRQKIEENERFEAARDRIARAKRQISRIEQKIEEHVALQEEARKYDVDAKVYEKVREAVSKKEVLSAIYEQQGLGEVSRSTKEGREQADRVTTEVVESIIEQLKAAGIQTSAATQGNVTQTGGVNINQNGGININIIDTINIVYGTDIPVKAGDARTTTMTEDEKNIVETSQKQRVKVKVVPHNGDEQKGKTPGPAPRDMEGAATGDSTPTGTTGTDTGAPTETKVTVVEAPQVLYGPPSVDVHVVEGKVPEDGTYRLKGKDIIQDEPVKKPEKKIYGPGATVIDPTTGKPVDQTPTGGKQKPTGGTGPVCHDPGDIISIDGTDGPRQVLYGPPPVEKPTEVKQKPPRGLMTIMSELTDGLDLKAKDGKRYKASNIKVFKGFKDELCSGNYLYNIVHLVPAIVKLPFNMLRKAAGKIMMRAESKKNIATLKKRLDKMIEDWKKTGDDSDLMTIFNEYRGNRVLQERFPTILNTLLEETMQKFALGKVTQINGELEQRYQAAFIAIRELDSLNAALRNPNLSAEDRKALETEKASLLKGQAANISAIRQGYVSANGWLTGGLHGFSEDMKAATTKLSIVGKRFAKDHDLNPDLLKRQAELERAEMQAIADGNDEMALRVFIENELLLSRNTEIKGSIFGRRSTGEKYYSPLAEQLDYRDDPFIRDLFTTIAVTSAAISTIQTIKASRDQAAIIAENNRRMAQNNQTMQQVNQIGQDIADKRGTMMEGMQAQGMEDTLAAANEIERAVLDKTNWGLGTSAYRTADNAGHAYYTSFFDGTKQAYEDIAQQYASGAINQAQAMQMMADLGTKTHQTFSAINTECLNILKPYAASHPQFDLTGVQGAMEYLQANPSAVQAMNQAMVDVTNAGDVLASMQLQQLIPLTTLPDSIRTVIINGAATAALASNINNSMGARKHTYGNSVTDMVDEYEESRTASTEAKGNASSK